MCILCGNDITMASFQAVINEKNNLFELNQKMHDENNNLIRLNYELQDKCDSIQKHSAYIQDQLESLEYKYQDLIEELQNVNKSPIEYPYDEILKGNIFNLFGQIANQIGCKTDINKLDELNQTLQEKSNNFKNSFDGRVTKIETKASMTGAENDIVMFEIKASVKELTPHELGVIRDINSNKYGNVRISDNYITLEQQQIRLSVLYSLYRIFPDEIKDLRLDITIYMKLDINAPNHYFSRENYDLGKEWYNTHFDFAASDTILLFERFKHEAFMAKWISESVNYLTQK